MSLIFLHCLVLMAINQFREYLEANGYDTSQMGLLESETVDETRSAEEKKSSDEKQIA